MAEFKKLSEVEQIETTSDNATVLVEEGGEIKRVPKKEVGGAGVGGYVIKLGSSSVTATDYGFDCSDNYDELYEILVSGGSAWVDYENAPEYVSPKSLSLNNATNFIDDKNLVMSWTLSDVGLILFDGIGNSTIVFPNGSHNLEPVDGGR